ncbi:hypothetical protein NXV57_15130 [Bacteroides thetaiotaomicron]|nr:hypothetical protein [Bacteroides thetaiotaomicron]
MQKEHTQELIDQEKIDYERQQQELKELYASGKDKNLNSEAAYNDAMEQAHRHAPETYAFSCRIKCRTTEASREADCWTSKSNV